MKICIMLLLFLLPLVALGGGRCTGSSSCRACTSCNYCQHCNSGGSCGVCGGGTSSGSYSSNPYSSGSRNYNSSNDYSPTYSESSDYTYSFDEDDESEYDEPKRSSKVGWFWIILGAIIFYYIFLKD